MRLPNLFQFTPEERRAVVAILLFTGGGGLLLEMGKRAPGWLPDLRLAAPDAGRGVEAPPRIGSVDSAAGGLEDTVVTAAGLGSHPFPAAADTRAAADPVPVARRGSATAEPLPGTPPPAEAAAGPPPRPLDVNRAGLAELDALPGIGPKLAERILEDRRAHGPFGSIDDLARVKGIGAVMVRRLKDSGVVARP